MKPLLKPILICLYACCLLLPLRAAAQPGFDRIYNYSNGQIQSVYRSVLADTQRIILAGTARRDNFDICNRNVSFIAAYSYSGNLLWKKQLPFAEPFFNGNEIQSSNCLVKLAPNRYAITLNGYLCDSIYSLARTAIYAFNENGDSLGFYKVPSGSTESNMPFALQIDAQHNLLVGGLYIGITGTEWVPGMLAKFTPSGHFLWNRTLQTADSVDAPVSQVLKIVSGNRANEYILGGYKPYYDSSSGNTTDAIWKTDTAGNVLWQRNLPKYPGWNNNYDGGAEFSIINASNGSGYYFATVGTKPVQFPGEAPSYRRVYYCGKVNEDGQVVWAKTYEVDTLGDAGSLNLMQKRNGDLLIAGMSGHFISMQGDSLAGCNLICTDSLGHVKWMKIYKHFDCPDQPAQALPALSLSPTESIVRAGGMAQQVQQSCWDTSGTIAWLVYTDSLGRLNANDTATWTLKEETVNYNPLAIHEPKAALPDVHIYPNPGKGLFNIRLNDPASLTLTVFDATGKQLLRKELKGTSMQVNLAGYPAGLYLFRLEDDADKAVVQMVVKE